MTKKIYTAVSGRLKAKVPNLKWIELNVGQLKKLENGESLPIMFPCALIDISTHDCENLSDQEQRCKASIEVTLLCDPIPIGDTEAGKPEEVLNNALAPFDLITDIYKSLQGFETDDFDIISRQSQKWEYFKDLYVYKIIFNCTY